MKKNKITFSFLLLGIVVSGFLLLSYKDKTSHHQNNTTPQTQEGEKILWRSFQEAVELNKKEKKKIFIDVYTDWCGWCKVMDKNTFTNPVIAKYMNKHFYAVKLNAEMKDTVVFNGTTFVNPNPTTFRSTHQLAASLLNNKLSYPTTVYLDENFSLLTQVPGYLQPTQMEPILKYFGNNAYPNTKWEDYQKTFKGEIK
ncbi:MAG: DUF255 domain-containing protein [Bacteroidota bacterium]